MDRQTQRRRCYYVPIALLVALLIIPAAVTNALETGLEFLGTEDLGNGRTSYHYRLVVSDLSVLEAATSTLEMDGMDGVLAQGDAWFWGNAGVTASSAGWVYEGDSTTPIFSTFDISAASGQTTPGTVRYELKADVGKVGTVPGPLAVSAPDVYAISGTVYLDQQPDETFVCGADTAISGLVVELLNAGGDVISTTTSNTAIYDGGYVGNYRFGELPAGSYTVRVPAVITTNGEEHVTVNGQLRSVSVVDASVNGVDFGYIPRQEYTVSGTVFMDGDANGLYEPSTEARLAGVQVGLVDTEGDEVATTSIADPIVDGGTYLGNYVFEDVAAGTYTVVAPTVAGQTLSLELTTPATRPAIVADAPVTGLDFGYRASPPQPTEVRIRGYVFFDVNNNGTMEADELPLGGVEVGLSSGDDEATVDTDDEGAADFGEQPAGAYVLSRTGDGGYGLDGYWTPTTPESYELAVGDDVEGPLVRPFGYFPDFAAIQRGIRDGDITGGNRGIGFWKHNIHYAIWGEIYGTELSRVELLAFLAEVETLHLLEPFDLGSDALAAAQWYLLPQMSGNTPEAKLLRHLLAAELNYVSGRGSSMPELEWALLWYGEYVANVSPDMSGTLKEVYDALNNLGD